MSFFVVVAKVVLMDAKCLIVLLMCCSVGSLIFMISLLTYTSKYLLLSGNHIVSVRLRIAVLSPVVVLLYSCFFKCLLYFLSLMEHTSLTLYFVTADG